MKVGDYVRTKDGIEKIIDISKSITFAGYEKTITTNKKDYKTIQEHCELLKSSPNIIDLIEVGDYVNGHKVLKIYEDKIKFGEDGLILAHNGNYDNYYLYIEDIKSVVTKEQFESMEYRIGD